jgi:DNA repair and recombination protein RAD52
MTFTDTQIAELRAPLNRASVKSRSQAGRSLSYIEGWHAIAEANRIFGFDAWDRETVELRECGEPRQVGDKFRVAFMCRVRIRVRPSNQLDIAWSVVRDGTGYGSGIDKDLGQAYESAIKEAETDAMKRALMTFGNPFGLALYDKDQANVVDAPAEPPPFVMPAKQMLHEISLCATSGDLDSLKADDGFRRGFKACSPDDRRAVLAALSPADGEEQAA